MSGPSFLQAIRRLYKNTSWRVMMYRRRFHFRRKYGARYSRDPHEPVDRICRVNPARILYIQSQQKCPLRVFDRDMILDGNWESGETDQVIERSLFFKAAHDRFIENRDWSETAYYQDYLERRSTGRVGKRKSEESIRKRLSDWEALYHKIEKKGYLPQAQLKGRNGVALLSEQFDEISVHVGRHGDLYLCQGRHRAVYAMLLGVKEVPVNILVRHAEWYSFKQEITDYTAASDGRVLSPLTHVDLQYIPTHFGEKRFDMIVEATDLAGGTLLDIGANWGYFSHRFEDMGFECTALEENERDRYYLERLKRAERRRFVVTPGKDAVVGENGGDYDMVLLLDGSREYLADDAALERLRHMLDEITMKEMYVQLPPVNGKIAASLGGLGNDQLAGAIADRTCLSEIRLIGNAEDGSPIYRIG